MIRFFRFMLVALALCVVALLSAIITMRFAIHGTEVTVPDFRGLTANEAMQKASSLDLNLSVDSRFYSTEMQEGRILTQSPVAGSVVRHDWHVRVTESLGPQKAAIPNVIGQQERAATIAVRRAGLDLGNVARMPYAGAEPGTVIAQNPAPDAAGMERPSLSLLVADVSAANTNGFVMPDLTGQTFTAAAQIVAKTGLKLAPKIDAAANIPAVATPGTVQAPAAPAQPGLVVSQNPAAGARVDANTPIQFTVTR